jgi:hypothetical protein
VDADGIKARGFGVSHLADSPGRSWFAHEQDGCGRLATGEGWLVVIDVPREIAEKYRYRFEDGSCYLGNYCIPSEVVNEYRSTFRFVRLDRPSPQA